MSNIFDGVFLFVALGVISAPAMFLCRLGSKYLLDNQALLNLDNAELIRKAGRLAVVRMMVWFIVLDVFFFLQGAFINTVEHIIEAFIFQQVLYIPAVLVMILLVRAGTMTHVRQKLRAIELSEDAPPLAAAHPEF